MTAPPERGSPEWFEGVRIERQVEIDRFNTRRSIEWRLAVTLWGGFGLIANAVADARLKTWAVVVLSVMGVLVVVFHALWVAKFMLHNTIPNWENGKILGELLRDELGISNQLVESQPAPNLWGYWWQVAITMVLAGFVIVVAAS